MDRPVILIGMHQRRAAAALYLQFPAADGDFAAVQVGEALFIMFFQAAPLITGIFSPAGRRFGLFKGFKDMELQLITGCHSDKVIFFSIVFYGPPYH